MICLMSCQVRFNSAGSFASAFQKLLIQSVLRVAMMSSYTARTSGPASLYSISPNVAMRFSLFHLHLLSIRRHLHVPSQFLGHRVAQLGCRRRLAVNQVRLLGRAAKRVQPLQQFRSVSVVAELLQRGDLCTDGNLLAKHLYLRSAVLDRESARTRRLEADEQH